MRDDRESRQLVRTVVVGVLVGAALLFLILITDMLWAPAWLEDSSAIGWALPLLCLVVILGVSWALLVQAGGATDADDGSLYVPCATCGRAIFREWRLCPYCGARISSEPSSGASIPESAPPAAAPSLTDRASNG